VPARLKPRQPQRWKWFSWAGGILRGIFAHARVWQGDVAQAGDVAEMTLTNTLELRVSDIMSILAALAAGGGVKFSPVYFTAVYNDADTLDLTGLPDLPEDIQFVGVVERLDATGQLLFWLPPNVTFDYDPATQELDVGGAAFTAGSSFMAVYVTTQNAYDKVLNALQMVQLNARIQDYIDTQVVADAEDLDFTTNPFIVKAETSLGIYVTWTCADQAGAFTLDIYAEAEDTDAGATWYDVYTGDWKYQGTPAATIAQFNSGLRITGAQNVVFEFLVRANIEDINRLRLIFDETAPAAGTVSAQVVIMNP
jgi:hypothetical protein